MNKLSDTINLNQLSLQKTFRLAFGVALVSTAALAMLSLRVLSASMISDRSVEKSMQLRTALHRLSTHLDDIQNNSRGYLITVNPIYIAPIQEALRAVPEDLEELKSLIEIDTAQWVDYQKLVPHVELLLTGASTFPERRRAHGLQWAIDRFKTNQGLVRMVKMRTILASIDREEGKMLGMRMSRRNSEYIQLQQLIAFAAVLAILFLSISCWRIMKNLEERKRSQQLLVEKSKMAALGEMASGIAHEINNPLGIIRGKAQILRILAERNELEGVKIADTGLKIEETVVRVDKIITALLNFAHGGLGDELQSISMHQLLESTLELCRSRFVKNNIDLRVSQPSPPLEVRCRPVELSQVLLNLLNNAFDAVQQHSKDRPWVEIRVKDDPSQLTIAVLDSGPGVPAEFRDKIMQPFFSTKEFGKGTGLGLSISKGIVESYGGVLRLREDAPTCFEMSLPK